MLPIFVKNSLHYFLDNFINSRPQIVSTVNYLFVDELNVDKLIT